MNKVLSQRVDFGLTYVKRVALFAAIAIVTINISAAAQSDVVDARADTAAAATAPKEARPATLEQLYAETDAAWSAVQTFIRTVHYPDSRNAKDLAAYDKNARMMRDLGLAFWQKYPYDVRSMWWLQRTLNVTPLYFKDGEESAAAYLSSKRIFPDTSLLDMAAKRAWDERYPGIRDSLLRRVSDMGLSFDLAVGKKGFQELYDQHFIDGQPVDRAKLDKQKALALDLIRRSNNALALASYSSYATSVAQNTFRVIDNDDERIAFARAMVATNNTFAQFVGAGLERRVILKRESMEMKFTALDGRQVDLKTLPAKIVLVDFWATSCSSCIADFPNLKKLRDKFGPRGFEIIGVALDLEENRQLVTKILAKHGVTWPQSFVGDSSKNIYRTKYGVRAVPLTLLLDENRKLIVDDARDLEQRLEALLPAT